MKHPIKPRLLAALLLSLLSTLSAQASSDETINGIHYSYDYATKTAEVLSPERGYGKYSGKITIPSSITTYPYDEKLRLTTYKVRSIGGNSFWGCSDMTEINLPFGLYSIGTNAFGSCSGLTEITIPVSVTEIGSGAFLYCTGLTSVSLSALKSINSGCFKGCTGLTSIVIPNSVTSISMDAFYGCKNLADFIVLPENTKYCSIDGIIYSKDISELILCPEGKKGEVIIPNTVISIKDGAFQNCVEISSVTIPNSITQIGNNAFQGCTGLTSLTIPNSVTYIGSYAFSDCTGMTSLTIPNSVTSIGSYAFSGCTGLTSMNIPNSVTSIGRFVFSGCNLHPLKIMQTNANYNDTFKDLNSKSDIVCSIFDYQKMKSQWSNNLYCYDTPYAGIKDLKEGICGVSFGVNTDKTYYEAGTSGPVFNAEVTDGSSTIGSLDNLSFDSSNIIKGLRINRDYNLHVYANLGDKKVEVYNNSFKTINPSMTVDYTSTQTTIKVKKIKASTDETFSTPRIVYMTSTGEEKDYTGGEITYNDLCPNQSFRINAYYGDDSIYDYISTKIIYVSANNLQTGPTSFNLDGIYHIGDAKLDKVEWLKDGTVVATSQHYIPTGLTPETDYKMAFRVTTVTNSGKTYSTYYSKTFRTSALDMEILNPKNVSAKKSIVAAKTNISDEETSVGFQWKKYDAPTSLPYSEAYTAICDGQIEGVINNLQSTYYNVRAFYKDANGKYYYSDLMTFDPTDFSFFQPTVHTYPAAVSPNSVQLKGYALEGTDDIISQGFEYWVSGAAKSERLNVAAASNINTVVAKGQRMTAELTNLKEGTEYTYRAFVETSAGRIYGDELSFTTPGMGAVDDIAADAPEITVVAYYDLSGRRYSVPQNGFNIVVYSDGTTKKIFFKH